jgi:hypothetical protein
MLQWLFHSPFALAFIFFTLTALVVVAFLGVNLVRRKRVQRFLIQELTEFAPQEIELYLKHYVWPNCQSVDPAFSDEQRNTIAVANRLLQIINNRLFPPTPYKHFIVLADSGMGKTSFLINYFAYFLQSRWRLSYNMRLISFGLPNLYDRITEIPDQEKTILLLDGFDRDTETDWDQINRISKIVEWTRSFYKVIITCRTGFFPDDKELSRAATRLNSNLSQSDQLPFPIYRLYISPFDHELIQRYLKQRFPIWHYDKQKTAFDISSKIPNHAICPFILTHIQNLMKPGQSLNSEFHIYSQLFEEWLEMAQQQTGEEKAILSGFVKKIAVEIFANRHRRGSERLTQVEIEPFLRGSKLKLANLQLSQCSFINRDSKGNYKFSQRSLLEFLFALSLLEHDKKAIKTPSASWTDQIRLFFVQGSKTYEEFDDGALAPKFFIPFSGGNYQFCDSKRTVTIKPFKLSPFPVTNQEYEVFDPSHRKRRDKLSDLDSQPVVYVSWEEAFSYCKWLSKKAGRTYRLPTEAEWEYAASGGGKRKYPWGNEDPDEQRANYYDAHLDKTSPVGSFHKGMTQEGLYDMAGNVWEWSSDWYDDEHRDLVVRGGSFTDYHANLRCGVRVNIGPSVQDGSVGFRLAWYPEVYE